MRRRILVVIAVIQSILFLSHWLLYVTWTRFAGPGTPRGDAALAVALGLLSVSFVAASLVAFRFSNPLARLFYTLSAVWVGFLTYLFLAACACWLAALVAHVAGIPLEKRLWAEAMLGLALLVGVYGIFNASWIRIKEITVPLANLPAQWNGRVAALVSDLHLGHVRNRGFARRVAATIDGLRPDVVFIAGDLYDGTAANLDRLAEPLGRISAPLGAYFVAGNHEEFRDHAKYLDAVRRAGIRVLDDEKIVLDGLPVVGVHYRDSTDPHRFQAILRRASLDPARPSLLLTHAPNHLEVAEAEGIALELCGHTHGGQFFPFQWMPAMVYGPYVYGLHRLGRLSVYTSSGVGTWGPPLRVGTRPEIVLIRFSAPAPA
ncbi:MAG TPA: metallophosphoesterase [Candidatus Dormibacteraeota bacterium]|nr:metallophosphoesterase [Candidatus Dormibacteraeota bacterium]